MQSFKIPTQQEIEKAVQRCRSPEHAAYFFARLENPNWVEPLHSLGIFSDPPPNLKVNGGTRNVAWPASKYLARMAKHSPLLVATIFARIDTDNASVVGDLLDAALAMPTDSAALLVPTVSKAAQTGALWIAFNDASDFCAKLAIEGEGTSALALARALFGPPFASDGNLGFRREEYWYKDGLKKVIPPLVAVRAEEFSQDISAWLRTIVQSKKSVDTVTGADFSYSWRPAIEEHEQNRDYDFACEMVGFVRQVLEEATSTNKITLDVALSILEANHYLVFKRIRVHLIRVFAANSAIIARITMMDRSLFDDHNFKHEYAMLVGDRFTLLTSEERATWFSWIDEGPDLSTFEESFKNDKGRDPSEDERARRREYWKFEKLHWVRTHLTEAREEFYLAMRTKHGEPALADLNLRFGPVEWENNSPIDLHKLEELGFMDAVNKVTSWYPSETSILGSNREDLASTFGRYVAGNPEEFSKKSHVLVGSHPLFVRNYITQMSEAVKANRTIDLFAVMELCKWVVEQPLEFGRTEPEELGAMVDVDWQWTRDEISRLVENVCQAMNGNAPRYPLNIIRQSLWLLLEALYRDRADAGIIHDISKDDPQGCDYLTLGINSPRGKAVGAALEYARWVANHIKQSDGKQDNVPDGFNAIPEVREMLQWQIAQTNRTFQAMSVIGSKIGLIFWIDRHWLAENAAKLFSLEGIEFTPPVAEGWAAWNAFLIWMRPHIEFYRLFKAQFAYAVARAVKIIPTERACEPLEHLGEHLILLYGRGQLTLDDDEQLLRQFLTHSNSDIRRHSIGFVGKTLQGERKVPDSILERFMDLWDWYWPNIGQFDVKTIRRDYLFGPWFTSGQFPEQWSLERLEQYVKVAPTPEPGHLIAERLAKIGAVDIGCAISALDHLVRNDKDGWHTSGWSDSAEKILGLALAAGHNAREKAVMLIDHLGRRGYTEFGKLL
jgi:hypothetical protein